jgi:hypothetical protein
MGIAQRQSEAEASLKAILSHPQTRLETDGSSFSIRRTSNGQMAVLATGSTIVSLIHTYETLRGNPKWYRKLFPMSKTLTTKSRDLAF